MDVPQVQRLRLNVKSILNLTQRGYFPTLNLEGLRMASDVHPYYTVECR
jgi:hypothetical protein